MPTVPQGAVAGQQEAREGEKVARLVQAMMPDNPHLNPRAAWRFPAKLVFPHHFIEYKGERWIEVEWPSDGKYDIGYQLALEAEGAMRLWELASRRIHA